MKLVDQSVDEGSLPKASQADRLDRPLDFDPRATGEVDGAAAVTPHHALCVDMREDLDRQPGRRSDDHRSREQRVGADRHQQKGFDVRPHDGATGRERVCRGAGGRRHDEAVAASISTVSSIMRSREAFSTVTSLRAQEEKTCSPPRRARTWSASRSSTR
jgi:hypothetical protein